MDKELTQEIPDKEPVSEESCGPESKLENMFHAVDKSIFTT